MRSGAGRETASHPSPERPSSFPCPSNDPGMRDPAPAAVQLRDYRPPAFLIESVELDFDIGEDSTRVRARLVVARNPAAAAPEAPLVLDAEEMEFRSA